VDFIEIIKTVIIGIVQGVTEWLPVSSTGHMILVDELIRLNVTDEFMDMFLVVIQLASILAVVVLFFKKLNPFSPSKTQKERKDTFALWSKVLIACVPAAIIGLLLDDIITELFFNYITVAITLILYGVIFIAFERRNRNRIFAVTDLNSITYRSALIIGIFQLLALIPGTSRSGATILGAMLIGTSRPVSAEFSFFLAIPVMFGASALRLLQFGFDFTGAELAILLTGMAVAFVVSIFTIKLLLGYVKKRDFTVFGYYRIAIGLIVIGYFVLNAR